MTDTTTRIVDAATVLVSWYRGGGNPDTERYKWLMDSLATAVEVHWRQEAKP